MSTSVSLSQDTATSLPGVNLKWVYTGVTSSAVKEISLIYFANTSDADISSMDIASGVVRTNLSSGLVSGLSYTFQLQIADISNNVMYSNALVLNAPSIVAPPLVTAVTGFDSALRVQLAATTNQFTQTNTNPNTNTVEFVLKREDNVVFWIVKPWVSSGLYMLSSSDDARLENNTSYRVACMYQPSPTSTQYTAPSAMSNSISATPSNLPNVPTNVTASSVGTGSLEVGVSWSRPSDFAEWSADGFVITLKLISSMGAILEHIITNQDVIQYVWSSLAETRSFAGTVQYSNFFGDGEVSAVSASVTPSRTPDLPGLMAATDDDQFSDLSWSAPFTGQSAITYYKIYKDGALLTTVSGSTLSYRATGLQNGFSYVFTVVAGNAIGESGPSLSLTAQPSGQMSIVSVVATGKSITAVLSPNGRPVKNIVLVAVDQDPNDLVDADFVVVIPQQEISQVATTNITVVKNFTGFSSDIEFYCCIAHNDINSTFYKSA